MLHNAHRNDLGVVYGQRYKFRGNKIQSGTLQVDLLVKGGNTGKTDYTSVKTGELANKPIFNYDLWEPGYTLVTYAKVVNNGTLALKYTLKFMSEDDIAAQKLAEVIDVFYAPFEVAGIDSRTALNEKIADKTLHPLGTLKDVFTQGDAVVMNDNLLAKDDDTNPTTNFEDYATIVLKMQENAGNEYQDQTISAFDIQLLATQYTYEEDTFDDKYDENATYPVVPLSFKIGSKEYAGSPEFINSVKDDVDENTNVIPETKVFSLEVYTPDDMVAISQMMKDGIISSNVGSEDNRRTIKLMNDIDMSGVNFVPFGSMRITFDGNNHKISNLAPVQDATGRSSLVSYGGGWVIKDLTIENATLKGTQIGAFFGQSDGAAMENCTLAGNVKVTWAQNPGDYKESYQAIGAVVGWVSNNLTLTNVQVADNTNITIVNDGMDAANEDGRPYQGTNPFIGAVLGGTKNADELAEDIIVGKNVTINGKPYAVKMTVNGQNYNVSPAFKKSLGTAWDDGKLGEHEVFTAQISTPDDLAAFSKMTNVSGWVTGDWSNMVTLNINDDLDFTGVDWTPIGPRASLTIEGNNHTISNLSSTLLSYAGYTFVNDLTIKNVTASGSQMGAFAAAAEGLNLTNCTLAGNVNITYSATTETWRAIGALVGWNSDVTFNNVNIADNTVITLDATGIEEGHADASLLTYDTYVGTGTYTGVTVGSNVTVNYTHD